jgi:hypothetical protein
MRYALEALRLELAARGIGPDAADPTPRSALP